MGSPGEVVGCEGVDAVGDVLAAPALPEEEHLPPEILAHDPLGLEVEEERGAGHVLRPRHLLLCEGFPEASELRRQQLHRLVRVLGIAGCLDAEEARVLVAHVDAVSGLHLRVRQHVAEDARRQPLARPARRELVAAAENGLEGGEGQHILVVARHALERNRNVRQTRLALHAHVAAVVLCELRLLGRRRRHLPEHLLDGVEHARVLDTHADDDDTRR
mmetsp:Transcript_30354/g.61115  ORF Transcript_30354/g.61115 Transcript_30354/m.61115 type:complete len:218 (+) Transcript_30354:195-848(+)